MVTPAARRDRVAEARARRAFDIFRYYSMPGSLRRPFFKISWTEDRDRWRSHRAGQMQQAGVRADKFLAALDQRRAFL